MNKVTYFDVEYANNKNKAICQLGIMCEDFLSGEPYYPEHNIYINPEDGFDSFCVQVHGITQEKVKNAPTFPEVWSSIEKYFTNSIIVGHNVAGSDIDALVRNLERYNIDIPELYYICTLDLAKEYIPSYAVKDYRLSTLCEYFGIDIDSEHDAFDDACACADLFKAIVDEYSLDSRTIIVNKYVADKTHNFTAYVSSPVLRKNMSEFYGVLEGIALDNEVTPDEIQTLINWKDENSIYSDQKEIKKILHILDNILLDGVVTFSEISALKDELNSYLDLISASAVTLSTQKLDGILKGIAADGKITDTECKNLQEWMYSNIHLSNHFPFNKTMEVLNKVLEDKTITEEESEFFITTINGMLDPVGSLKEHVYNVENKHVCLSGVFAYGQKEDVEKYIVERGGIVEPSVKKTTDILLIGDCECQEYSNGTYGTKVKKAIEYNGKGCSIKIVKETDFFNDIK